MDKPLTVSVSPQEESIDFVKTNSSPGSSWAHLRRNSLVTTPQPTHTNSTLHPNLLASRKLDVSMGSAKKVGHFSSSTRYSMLITYNGVIVLSTLFEFAFIREIHLLSISTLLTLAVINNYHLVFAFNKFWCAHKRKAMCNQLVQKSFVADSFTILSALFTSDVVESKVPW